MILQEYFNTKKYTNYTRNQQIFREDSSGVFYREVASRVKLELMGAGAVVSGDSVLAGYDTQPIYSPIASLIVPSTLLSSATSTYISYATGGTILFNGEKDGYLEMKVKEILREQSVGGSVLIKKIEADGDLLLNIYSPLSYFTEYDDLIQDHVKRYTIFNKVNENDEETVYIMEIHENNFIKYQYVSYSKETGSSTYLDTELDGYATDVDPDTGKVYSYELLTSPIVTEVQNVTFDGGSDYTEDNVALLRELVVTNTINSQTFDKISNPLLAMPEEALEYDENGNAKVNLSNRVVIIRDKANMPQQVSLESRIEQSQIHKQNIEDNIYSSLAINRSSLGLTDLSQLSGEALRRMMSSTISRVEEKRQEIVKAFDYLLGIEVVFDEVIQPTFEETVNTVSKAVTDGVMSQKKGVTLVSGEEDYEQLLKEQSDRMADYGFMGTTTPADESQG